MRILTRYIFREVFNHSLLGLVVFTFVIFIPHISHVLEVVVRHDLTAFGMVTLFALPIPGIVVLTIPMAVLVGILIGLSRMSADGEVIAARALGMGLERFLRPVMFFALLGCATAMWMSLVLAPQATRKLVQMENSLKSSQAPYEIQPRVFIEQFPNLLIYIQDVAGTRSRWRGVFISDTSVSGSPKITLAEGGRLTSDPAGNRLVVHLENGITHETDPQNPLRYSAGSFSKMDLPILIEQPAGSTDARRSPSMLTLASLVIQARSGKDAETKRAALLELHYRLALPIASVVMALVGIPLGLFTRKGGKAVGVTLTILIVFVYYILMAFGLSLARQGRVAPGIGLWFANSVFAIVGVLMLTNLRGARQRFLRIQDHLSDLVRHLQRRTETLENGGQHPFLSLRVPEAQERPKRRLAGERFFQILDVYIIKSWLFYFVAMLVTFTGIYMIFDFFQLLGDIVRNHVAVGVVLNYYRYLCPYVIYLMMPLSILVATLVSFGILTKTNQVTAIKATGTSLYRIALPVMLAAAMASAGMFIMDDYLLPSANQRQDALRNQIKGKPAQTHYRPDVQWIFGQEARIYNYRFFNADRDEFANLSVFEFDPKTFQLNKRIYAARAFWEDDLKSWVLERGWVRYLEGDRVTMYTPFAVATFDELSEQPPYFKKEVKPSAQMNAFELRRYIDELRQSGFNVVQLSVQFYRKFSFPLMAFVISLIAIPFSFSTGTKGALSGIAISIGIAMIYLSTASLFEAMGNLNQLPPVMAVWSPDVVFGLGGAYLLLKVKT